MKRTIGTLVLSAFLATAAQADLHARIEGPDADGLTYTARILDSDARDAFEPWALAEGVVDGKRRSVLIRVHATDEHGVYRFTRSWPQEGQWMIRFNLGHWPAPATVAALRADGSVRKNQLFKRTDGATECHRALEKSAKLDPDQDC
jgi:hypothetical protein